MRNRRHNILSNVVFTSFGIEKMNVRQPSLVDEFYIEKNVCFETDETSHSFVHPLYMLFNQERLNRLGDGAVQQWLKNLDASGNSAYSELKSKLSDEDMLSIVKSRHIQHPSELESWINHLNSRADAFNAEVQKLIAAKKEQEDKLPPSELDDPDVKSKTE